MRTGCEMLLRCSAVDSSSNMALTALENLIQVESTWSRKEDLLTTKSNHQGATAALCRGMQGTRRSPRRGHATKSNRGLFGRCDTHASSLQGVDLSSTITTLRSQSRGCVGVMWGQTVAPLGDGGRSQPNAFRHNLNQLFLERTQNSTSST